MKSFTTIIDALQAANKKVTNRGSGKAMVQCPAHDDGRASLSVTHIDDKTLLYCFAGCGTGQIVEAIGLSLLDLWDEQTTFTGVESMTGYQLLINQISKESTPTTTPKVTTEPIEYIYKDENGQPVGKKIRLVDSDGKKTFRQQRFNNGDWLPGLNGIDLPLYNLHLINALKGTTETLFIVEGEKDAETLIQLGEVATTMPNGAGSWNDRYTDQLQGINGVYLIADNDEPGLKHAATVKDALETAGIGVRLLLPADGHKDITDHINAGKTLTDLKDADQIIQQIKQQQYDETLRKLVIEETLKQTARDTARKQISDANASTRYTLPTYAKTLTEELQKPDEAIRYIIDQLWPVGANISLTATYKAGKTSTINNIVKSLVDELPLFGHFQTTHTGRIAIWNYEVSGNQMRQWLREVNIKNTDQISLLNMRGHTWPLSSEYIIKNTIQWLQENNINTWIVDPLARAFVGSGDENSNQDVGIFLDTLDYIKEQAGVANLLIAAHTGRNAEQGNSRARGASRFDDWVDARWMLTKDKDENRWFTADGRDVTIKESKLDYDETTRAQIIQIGVDRKQSTTNELDERVYQIIAATGLTGINQAGIAKTHKAAYGSESISTDTSPLDRMSNMGLIYFDKIGNSKLWKVTSHDLNAT
jgi:5S rRNA maturation endonuclease (ribonuclease M5)